jgi:lipoprotein-anchoring transpeptidase ErfK/SrfK
MTSRFVNPKCKQMRLRPAYLAIAVLAVLIAAGGDAGARSGWSERTVDSIKSRSAGEPIMAIVSLRNQRITVYDAKGWILRAPVSSGSKRRETPAGIFSVIQKVKAHYSNLYDDAYMPHMQRITWSGIALHGGRLPGYPASHGCVRMPFGFAARLFDVTRMGLRVIVAPSDVTPVEIAHPGLFQPRSREPKPWPPPEPQRRKRRRGKRPTRDSPQRRPTARPRGPWRRCARRKI